MMKALAITERPTVGDLPNAIRMLELPIPEPSPGEVRIRVSATAVNVDDQHFAEGTMFGGFPVSPVPKPERPWVPGTDFAGIVDAVGSKVEGVTVGQAVFGIRPPKLAGPWAEFCITHASHVAPIPSGWSVTEAAALCLGGTVITSILKALGPLKGKTYVIVGASGSLGTLLVSVLSKAGAAVLGVCSERNRALVSGLGATAVFDYNAAPWRQQAVEHGGEVDAVIDMVGGKDVESDARSLIRKGGVFVTVVGPEKHVGEKKLGVWGLTKMIAWIVRRLLASRFSGPRYVFAGPLAPDFMAINRWIVQQGLRPVIDRAVPFEQEPVRQALAYVATHRARGKVVIEMSPENNSR